jgi:hypothetical protein
MLSLTKCKNILNKNGIKYTDDEIEKIRLFLYNMAEVQQKTKKINYENNSLHKSEHR